LFAAEAIDIFVESDPGDGEDGPSFISVRVPYDREFARQIKEFGAKWDDQTKEWRLYGNEELVQQIASLCKTVFPGLPRRRNRLVAAQLSILEGDSWLSQDKQPTRQIEVVARIQFVVNRTIKTYRLGQNLKWVKEFRRTIELPSDEETKDSASQQNQFTKEIQKQLPELEKVASAAFEALLVGRKEAVAAILSEAGIEQI
jgi:hypothetical protein